MRRSKAPFYLTGGTALGRAYFGHRYSDDLDLFVNRDGNYSAYVEKVFEMLEEAESALCFSMDRNRLRKFQDFTQLFLFKEIDGCRIDLKIDLVNDISAHYGGFIENPLMGRIDSWRNILSNKISAVFRYEPKDIADIWVVAKNECFEWKEIVEEAKSKEVGVDPVPICQILKTFPQNYFQTVKWIVAPDPEEFTSDLDTIADDILSGRLNNPW